MAPAPILPPPAHRPADRSPNQSINTTFAGLITGAGGSLTKTGSATLTLSRANTYTGLTTISAGTLEGGVSGSIPANVTVSSGTLKLDSASAMSSSATLTLASSPGAGAVNLNFSGTQTINALYFGTTQKAAGTWAASGATHNNPLSPVPASSMSPPGRPRAPP